MVTAATHRGFVETFRFRHLAIRYFSSATIVPLVQHLLFAEVAKPSGPFRLDTR